MAVTMAGLRGGRIGLNEDQGAARFVKALLAGAVATDQARRYLTQRTAPKTLTLVVNNSCNLSCPHCYLQVERLTAPLLKRFEWEALINSVWNSGVELI